LNNKNNKTLYAEIKKHSDIYHTFYTTSLTVKY